MCCAIQFHLPSHLSADEKRTGGIDVPMEHERRLQEEVVESTADQDPEPVPPPVSVVSVPLHSEHGTHHAYLYVGSPPQRRTLIVDTGSRLVAFPCTPCPNCGTGHASPSYYDPSVSTTDVVNACPADCRFDGMSKCANSVNGTQQQQQQQQCRFVQRYTEGSRIEAYEITDVMWLGTADVGESTADPTYVGMAVPFVFGCQTSEEGLFRHQYADGIMGVAMHQTTLIAAMYEAGAIPRHAFSLCLNFDGGVFSLGGTKLGLGNDALPSSGNATSPPSTPHHLEPMQFAPLAKNHGWYAVGVMSLHLGDILITTTETLLSAFNDGKGTIIDSGTTDSYLPRVIARPFRRAWETITGHVHSNKLERYTYARFRRLPNITITVHGLRGTSIRWSATPSNYMEEMAVTRTNSELRSARIIKRVDITKPWEGTKSFTNRIYVDEPNGCVVGGNWMADHDVLFDVQGKRIGIARAECTSQESPYIIV